MEGRDFFYSGFPRNREKWRLYCGADRPDLAELRARGFVAGISMLLRDASIGRHFGEIEGGS